MGLIQYVFLKMIRGQPVLGLEGEFTMDILFFDNKEGWVLTSFSFKC